MDSDIVATTQSYEAWLASQTGDERRARGARAGLRALGTHGVRRHPRRIYHVLGARRPPPPGAVAPARRGRHGRRDRRRLAPVEASGMMRTGAQPMIRFGMSSA